MIGKTVSHFKIIEKLGAGGMGEVYLAEDTRLDRKVALKFLPLHFTANTESLARFEREAKATAALNHPNIITVHEIGDHENQTFIAMEYVKGASLRERMAKELSLSEILDLLTQICSGLGKAHEADVVHRDIKPENIMIDLDGRVRILDFGLAKLKGVTKLTKEVSTLGTLNYMSPEQFQALEVDHRTDIWSLGVILYEMITGELPFAGDYEAAVMYSVLNEDLGSLTSSQFDVPGQLELVVNKTLVKNPDERYQQINEMLVDLESISGPASVQHDTGGLKSKRNRSPFFMPAIVAILLLAIVGVSYLYFNFSASKTGESATSERKMLAVLPFENLGLPEDEYFADGMTDEIITRLARLQGLGVIARNSAMQYKNSDKSIGQIGDELGVDYVLQGTIRWQKVSAGSGQVRVTPKLIKVSDATNLWANVYQRDMSDIFQVQSDIASSVVAAMNIKLLNTVQALAAQPTDNLEAYNYYLRGNDYIYKSIYGEKDWRIAANLYEKATELDSNFVLAYTQLTRVHLGFYWQDWDHTDKRLAMAKRAVDKAQSLAPNLPETNAALGWYRYYGFRDYESALRHFNIALQTQPNNSDIVMATSVVERRRGNWEQARLGHQRACELDPRSAWFATESGYTYVYTGYYSGAEQLFKNAIALAPDRETAYCWLALLYLNWQGDKEKALEILRQGSDVLSKTKLVVFLASTDGLRPVLRILSKDYDSTIDRLEAESFSPSAFGDYLLFKANIYARSNQPKLKKAYYDSLRTYAKKNLVRGFTRTYYLGQAYAGLGLKEEAIREAKNGVELLPVSKDTNTGPLYVIKLAMIYLLVGEHDLAIDRLAYLLSIPSPLSANLLRLDPFWEPIRDHPKFKQLLQKYSAKGS